MATHLIVTGGFGAYGRGDRIEDPAEVQRVLEAAPAHVVRVAAPDAAPVQAVAEKPAPAPPAPEVDDPGALG